MPASESGQLSLSFSAPRSELGQFLGGVAVAWQDDSRAAAICMYACMYSTYIHYVICRAWEAWKIHSPQNIPNNEATALHAAQSTPQVFGYVLTVGASDAGA